MKRELNGQELAEFIKERQAHMVRGLRQAEQIQPKLAIIRTNPEPVVDSYMKIKTTYGDDILVDVDVHTIDQANALALIKKLNSDEAVHGIIVQIPLPDRSQTVEVLNAVAPEKDVDGLSENSMFDCPTPLAIDWLLNGYNKELKGKRIVIIGNGRLVGKPLAKLWRSGGYDVEVADRNTKDLGSLTRFADIIVSATGVPGLLKPDM